jgi:muramoyltetrapeptide carboxypeptidase
LVFSDVTVLHNHLNTLGFKSIHGIMPITAPRATTQATLRMALFGENFPTLFSFGKNKTGKASGELVGGNHLFCIVYLVRHQQLTVLKSYLLKI